MADEMRVLVRAENGKRQTAVLEKGILVEYYQEERPEDSLVGSLIWGRVEQVLPKVKAAFVNIGQDKNGFLPLSEMESFHQSGHGKPLITGQEILVQVKKAPKDEKGAFLTRDVALPGQFCVYMPMNRHVGVSGRVTEEGERAKARALGQAIAGGEAGVIVRHAALQASLPEVREEYEALAAYFQSLLGKAPYLKAPSLLHQETTMAEALLRDYGGRFTVELIESGTEHTEIELAALWQGAGVERQLAEALGRRVNLPNGGTLVIDEGEALTAIDVNTAHFLGGEGDIALSQNLAACGEIARQIRLRNLGGILLIDFIGMKTIEEQAQVQEALALAVGGDRIKTVIHGFTSLGLLEMTRRRTRETLRDMLTVPCGKCHGTGRTVQPTDVKKGRQHS